MNKQKKNNNLIIAVVCTAMITFSITYLGVKFFNYRTMKPYRLIAETENYIDRYFYFDKADKDEMIDSAIEGFVNALDDKYSRYQSLQITSERNDSQAGVHTGIGITVSRNEEGYMIIEEVREKSPAEKAGLLKDDIITALDSKDVVETGYNESVDYIKNGEENSTLVVTLKRGSETIDIEVKREKIEIITSEARMMEDYIGYINITQFNEKTPEQVQKNFTELLSQGAKGIIFDVRNNGGGLVSSVEKCLDPLLPEGDIAVAVYKDGREETIVKSDAEETDIPMTVLVNKNSASGAELFAASLRDFKNTELVGTTTFGKGIMQDTFELSNGSTVVLTVAAYKTTRSECYHGTGLVPDFEIENDESGYDFQLDKATEVVKKKIN